MALYLPSQLSSTLPSFSCTDKVKNIWYIVPNIPYNKNFLQWNNFWKHSTLSPTSFRIITHYPSLNISWRPEKAVSLQTQNVSKTLGTSNTFFLAYLLKSCRTVWLHTTVGEKLQETMSPGANCPCSTRCSSYSCHGVLLEFTVSRQLPSARHLLSTSKCISVLTSL